MTGLQNPSAHKSVLLHHHNLLIALKEVSELGKKAGIFIFLGCLINLCTTCMGDTGLQMAFLAVWHLSQAVIHSVYQ